MGAALETVIGYNNPATTTAGTYTAFTAITGQSFTIRATPNDQAGSMFGVFGEAGVNAYLQIRSARMHDQTIGTTFVTGSVTNFPVSYQLTGLDYDEPIWNVDSLTVQSTTFSNQGSATYYSIGMQMYYPSLGGINQNMMTWAQVQSYVNPNAKTGLHYTSWVTATTSGTHGALGTGVAINSTNDQFKANHSYALLGYLSPSGFSAVLIQGTDTGNLYVGGPGSAYAGDTRNYFVDLSIAQNIACIPVIQANNKAGTYVYNVDGQNATTAYVTGLIWLDLGVNVRPVGT